MFVRPWVHFVSRSICQKSANLWQSIIGRILNSNLINNVKICHPSNCDDLVLRTQKVASGPPLPCGCNLVERKHKKSSAFKRIRQRNPNEPSTSLVYAGLLERSPLHWLISQISSRQAFSLGGFISITINSVWNAHRNRVRKEWRKLQQYDK